MPGMFNGKATEYAEYIFKMEAFVSTLDPGGKGDEIIRAAATEAKDMDDDEATNLEPSVGTCQHSTVRWHHA